jgi:hypothetical protein
VLQKTVLGYFGFDRTFLQQSQERKEKWHEELKEQRAGDIETERSP